MFCSAAFYGDFLMCLVPESPTSRQTSSTPIPEIPPPPDL